MHKAEIETLLELVRGLKGPNREVDALLDVTIAHPGWHRKGSWIASSKKLLANPRFITNTCRKAIFYTASLDAIVGLIERELPGWIWGGVFRDGDCFASVRDKSILREGHLSTPALSLCAAFLAAKLALIKETDDAGRD